ncbi:DUF1508 domain-containing protein [Variovorax sp. UMC13]|uniref:DUF1508 domain-containing protein n=1 Tax=Variovorax sp. UMC13 TaxID=1862326 RepID=UPI00386E7676
MRFVVVPELGGRWTWVMRDGDGNQIAKSSLSWLDRDEALRAIEVIRAKVPKALVFDPLGSPISG